MGNPFTKERRLHRALVKVCVSREKDPVEKVKKLIEAGVDVNSKTEWGVTALMYACDRGKKASIKELILAGADVNAKDNNGHTSLYRVMGKWVQSAYLAEVQIDLIKILFDNKCDINAKNNNGRTALHQAAALGRFNLVQFLVEECGADLDILDNRGNCVEAVARDHNNHGVVSFILKHKEKLRALKSQGMIEQAPKKVVEDGWKFVSPDEIALVSKKEPLNYILTDIFNFKAREFTRISRNLKTDAEAITVVQFDDVANKEPLEEAHKKLVAFGGNSYPASIKKNVLNKLSKKGGLS